MFCPRCKERADDDGCPCWFCTKSLCSPCWEAFGHCGHPEAERLSELGRREDRPLAHASIVGAIEMARSGTLPEVLA